MDALFLSCESSVYGSIPSHSLTDDAQHDPYSFSSLVSMMAATFPPSPDLLIAHNAEQGWPFGLRAPSKRDVHHSLHLLDHLTS